MTVPSTLRLNQYAGDGIATQFAFNFRIDDDDHLVVTLIDSSGTETTQTKITHYTVSGVGVQAGGTITMLTPPPTGTTIRLERTRPLTQDTDLRNQGTFKPENLELALDALEHQIQQLDGFISVVSTLGGLLPTFTLAARPTADATWAGKFIRIKDAATPEMLQYCIENGPSAAQAYQWNTLTTGSFI